MFIYICGKAGGLLIQSPLCGHVLLCYKGSCIDLSIKGVAFEDTGCEIRVREQGASYHFWELKSSALNLKSKGKHCDGNQCVFEIKGAFKKKQSFDQKKPCNDYTPFELEIGVYSFSCFLIEVTYY